MKQNVCHARPLCDHAPPALPAMMPNDLAFSGLAPSVSEDQVRCNGCSAATRVQLRERERTHSHRVIGTLDCPGSSTIWKPTFR